MMPTLRTLALLTAVGLAGFLSCTRPGLAAEGVGSPGSDTWMTNAAQILRLGVDQAQRVSHPVSISGIVTCPMPEIGWVYLQDGEAGMLVLYTNQATRLVPGQKVRVTGRTFAGQFAVHVAEATVQVTGDAGLPEPKRANASRLAAGEDFGSWVAVQGRVVDLFTVASTTVLSVASGPRRFLVHGPTRDLGALPGGPQPDLTWLDALVEVRGICWTETDTWNRPIGFRIHAPSSNCVQVLEAGQEDVFDRPLTRIATLLPGTEPMTRRVRIQGTVTHQVPGQWIFLQERSDCVRVRVLPAMGNSDGHRTVRERSHSPDLKAGDRIEIVGYPTLSGATTVLVHAEYRRIGHRQPIVPTEVDVDALLAGCCDGRLITVQARLADRQTRVWGAGVEEQLRFLSPEGRLRATLKTDRTNALPSLHRGALIQMTGVCLVAPGEFGTASVPQILLRSAEDIRLLSPAWPWDSLAPGRILAVAAGLCLVASVWIILLSRQVRQRRHAEERLSRTEATSRIISYFATSLLEQDNEDEILWDLAKNCVARLGFVDCVVYRMDADRRRLIQTAAHGPKNPAPYQILNPITIPLGEGIVGSVASTGKAAVIADTRKDPRYIVDDAVRLSEIAVPIIANGEVIGVIDSEHPDPHFFTAEHRRILESIASLCANKLVRVRAERRLRELNQELERRIGQRTAELVEANLRLTEGLEERARAERVQKALYEISEAVPTAPNLPALYARIHAIIATLMRADNFYLALLDPVTETVSFPYHRDLIDPPPAPRSGRRGMTEYVLRTGRPTLADLQEIQRLKDAGEYHQSGHPSAIWLGVPLTLNGTTFGVMAVQDQHDPNAFDEDDKRLLSFVARQTALAIERKRQEEELRASTRRLRESEERFAKAFRSTPAVLSIMRLSDERWIEVNEAFLSVFGFSREEILGQTPAELGLWADALAYRGFIHLARVKGSVRAFEARLRTKHAAEEVALMSGEAIELNGEPCVLVLTLLVTARKRAEEELLRTLAQERELNELKSRFVSMVSHEFRTPLGIILSSAEILENYFDRLAPNRRRENLDGIVQATRQMAALMEEVLLIGRAEAGQLEFRPQPLDLGAFVHRVAGEVVSATRARCPIQVRIDADPPQASADANLLRHILTNLLTNAVKYSPHGTSVTISLRFQNTEAELTIADQGIGIPDSDAGRIFQAFHRGRNVGETPGSGLGLMIVRHCVELHRGRIHFETSEGHGTTFRVTIPLSHSKPSTPPDPLPSSTATELVPP